MLQTAGMNLLLGRQRMSNRQIADKRLLAEWAHADCCRVEGQPKKTDVDVPGKQSFGLLSGGEIAHLQLHSGQVVSIEAHHPGDDRHRSSRHKPEAKNTSLLPLIA